MTNHKRYWERIRRTVNLANAKDREKARAEHHRLYIATGSKKYMRMSRKVTTKDVKQAYKIAKRRIWKQARKMHQKIPQIKTAFAAQQIEAALFEEEQYPTHFRSDVEIEDLP